MSRKDLYEGRKYIRLDAPFKDIALGGYYTDKTLFIKDFLDRHAKVTYITGPRRFGKSLLLRMMKVFFEKYVWKPDEKNGRFADTSVYFKDLKISRCGKKYTSMQGKFPVIYIDFFEEKPLRFGECEESTRYMLREEFCRHSELRDSPRTRKEDREFYKKMTDACGYASVPHRDVVKAVRILSRMLFDHYGVKPIILVDEFDSYLHGGYYCSYYRGAVGYMKDFFTESVAKNEFFEFAVMTAIPPVSMKEIFGDYSDVEVSSVYDGRFAKYVGFEYGEVREFLDYYGIGEDYDKVISLFGGYTYGDTPLACPVSVLKYVWSDLNLRETYWFHTMHGIEFRQLLNYMDHDVMFDMIRLFQGEKLRVRVPEELSTEELFDIRNIYSVMMTSGYLRFALPGGADYGKAVSDARNLAKAGKKVRVELVNEEVSRLFYHEMCSYCGEYPDYSDYFKHYPKLTAEQERYYYVRRIESDISVEDEMRRAREQREKFNHAYYHRRMFGVYVKLSCVYRFVSGKKLEDARYRMTMKPKRKGYNIPYVVIDYAFYDGKMNENELDRMAEELATNAARDFEGEPDVLAAGIAFSGKYAVTRFMC